MRNAKPGRACYYRGVTFREGERPDGYPFDIPAVKEIERLRLKSPVTFLIGENGSGKSTVIEAVAVRSGLNAEGGSRHLRFMTRKSHSSLSDHIRMVRGTDRMTDSYFLRAESFYNVATALENLSPGPGDDGRSLHDQSHGEAFFSLLKNRLTGGGFYVFDEPEAALSPQRQLAMLVLMHRLVLHRGQLLVATHSPILLAYPQATIYLLDEAGMRPVRYEETDHYVLTRRFLTDHENMMEQLIRDEEDWFGGAR